MRNHQLYRSFKSEESPAKRKTSQGHDASLTASSIQNQKKFFDIEYIFEDPVAIKRRRYHVEPKTPARPDIDKNYKTLEPKADLTTSVILKAEENLLNVQPVREKQLLHLQKAELSFNTDSKRSSIHARKFNQNSSIFKSLSVKKTERNPVTKEKPFQSLLSSRNYSFHRETRSAQRQKRRTKVERQIKKLESSDLYQITKGAKKSSKIQSDQFRKYCEKNIELAKNAFLFKNKQMIRIYRPWSPINIQEGYMDYQFGEPI